MRFALLLLTIWMTISCALAETEILANWEGGFEVEVPDVWLRRDLREAGIKLNSDQVNMMVETYSGITQAAQIERLHEETKAAGYGFKSERSFAINQVPAHEMVFFKDGEYKIFYVLIAGDRGFLWTVDSRSTDSKAFLEGQDIINSFRVRAK